MGKPVLFAAPPRPQQHQSSSAHRERYRLPLRQRRRWSQSDSATTDKAARATMPVHACGPISASAWMSSANEFM
jgi:hypothetical protein